MSRNKIYDAIIVGASIEGLKLYEKLQNASSKLNILIISEHFKHCSSMRLDSDSLNKIQQKVIYSSYTRGLINLTLADKTTVHGLNLIVATGTKPLETQIKNNNIKYNLLDTKPNKSAQAVVVGNNNLAVSYALNLAKKFKYVYLCTTSFELNCDQKNKSKVNATANVLHLPNCSVISCKNNKDGELVEVCLDTYSAIKSSAVIFSLGQLPDTGNFANKLITLDTEGYIEVNKNGQTLKVPNIFAVGRCTKISATAKLYNNIIEILS